ncbi:polyketide beta-ketoacyl-synthase [Stygiomarasmius scandens]|uniref:Polyketide beta-ketoacyl-synthase n=1 Tax=Marasmiellus scandens TaxID=2682957 RepID=A0ABR1IW82_9AGAR
MDTTFQRLTQISLLHDYGLFHGSRPNLPLIWPISLILPSITIFQIALFDLLVSLGIKPDIVVGHSAGETAGSYASGALSKDMAVELSIIRGLSFSTIESIGGTMGALSCSPEDAQKILAEVCQTLPDQILEIACFNSPTAVAISGHESAIKLAIELAESKGIFARKIRTSVPIHSSLMDHCLPIYVSKLEDLFSRFPGDHKPQITTFSTLTGAAFTDTIDATYFWNNTRSQVKFTHSIEAMTSEFSDLTFVELSPHPVLSSYISSMVTDKSVVLATARRPKDRISEEMDILHLCGKLTSCGHNCVDFTFLNQVACYSVPISLPPYPFAKVKFPLYPTSSERDKQMESRFGPINHRYLKINKDTHPILSEHVIRSEPIMPAAGFMEMVL